MRFFPVVSAHRFVSLPCDFRLSLNYTEEHTYSTACYMHVYYTRLSKLRWVHGISVYLITKRHVLKAEKKRLQTGLIAAYLV